MPRSIKGVLPLAVAGAIPFAALAQVPAPSADPVGIVDRFLHTLQGGYHDRLGALVTERVATGDGESLRRDQVLLLHQGYTEVMFGPLRSHSCEAPASNQVVCRLNFQSRWLSQRYTIDGGLISGIETLPATDETAAK